MRSKVNILPLDPYDRNLLEMSISNQKEILESLQRIEQRLEALEVQQCLLTTKSKNKTPEVFYTNEQVMEMLQLSRSTLHNYRKAELINFTKVGNTIRYSQADVDNFRKRA